ncbi:benzoate 4-monooxygenase cytochrome P450 [Lojkania enalia]|uniref:Benzoate 4-monooxygenase cytochrome P450 n=1 Tax=Lojkania enalia TaxID=147567 RepID=A0A9P4K1H7_9PLEO|nr:benzoate 4-monooxygenase cytochrome P450 [Didymosphaeria enalia]
MAIISILVISPKDLLVLTVLFSCSWTICHIIYNLFFHPLHNIPGPFFGRISQWPSAYHARKGDRHIWLQQCFEKYRNKIRVKPNAILFRSPKAARDIYGSKANVKRGVFYAAMQRKEEERNTVSTIDNLAHAKRRKLLNLAFTEKSLRASAVFMEQHIDRRNELLITDDGGEGWSEPLNFIDMFNTLVFDILGDICFGKSFEAKEPGDDPIKAIPHAIEKAVRSMYALVKSPLVGAIPGLRPRGLSRLVHALRPKEIIAYDDFVESTLKGRLENRKDPKASSNALVREDMLHFLTTAVDPDTGLLAFSDGDIKAETRMLLVAGQDTTSVAMSGLFFYLAHYPKAHAKLVKEVTSTFPTAEDITPGPKLSSCKYLRACIDEAMRISPPGLSELPREVMRGGIIINDDFFPEGTIVGTAGWTDNRNEEVYDEPEIYRPERWIPGEGTTAEGVSRIKAAFHLFFWGPFNCAGTNFAYQELMLMVAKTVYRLDFRVPPGSNLGEGPPIFPLIDAYITIRDGPILQFRKRQ